MSTRPPDATDPRRPPIVTMPPVESNVPAGYVLDPVTESDTPEVEARARRLMATAAGGPAVIWQDGDSEVVLYCGETKLRALHGLLLFGIVLEAVETEGPKILTVAFSVAPLPTKLSGMVVASEQRPRGTPVLVDRWGEATLAIAYRTFMDVAAEIAGACGSDQLARPLVAGAVFAQPNRLGVIPQARDDAAGIA